MVQTQRPNLLWKSLSQPFQGPVPLRHKPKDGNLRERSELLDALQRGAFERATEDGNVTAEPEDVRVGAQDNYEGVGEILDFSGTIEHHVDLPQAVAPSDDDEIAVPEEEGTDPAKVKVKVAGNIYSHNPFDVLRSPTTHISLSSGDFRRMEAEMEGEEEAPDYYSQAQDAAESNTALQVENDQQKALIRKLKQEITAHEKTNSDLKKDVKRIADQSAIHENDLKAEKSTVTTLRDQIAVQTSTLANGNAKIKEHDNTIAGLRNQIQQETWKDAAREKRIEQFNDNIVNTEARTKEMRDNLETRDKLLKSLIKENEKKEKDLTKQEEVIDKREAALKKQQDELIDQQNDLIEQRKRFVDEKAAFSQQEMAVTTTQPDARRDSRDDLISKQLEDLASYEKEALDLQKQVNEEKRKLSELDRDHKLLLVERDSLQVELQTATTKIGDALDHSNQLDQTAKDLRAEQDRLKKENANMQTQKLNQAKSISTLQAQLKGLNDLKQDKDALAKRLSDQQDIIQARQTRITELEARIAQLTQDRNAAIDERDNAVRERRSLEDQLQKAPKPDEVDGLAATIQQLRGTNGDLLNQLDQRKADLSRAGDWLRERDVRIGVLENDANSWRQQKANLEGKADHDAKAISELEGKLFNTNENVEGQRRLLKESERQLAKLTRDHDDLRTQLDDQSKASKADANKAREDVLNNTINTSQAKINQLEGRIAKLLNEKAQLENRNDNLTAEVQRIRGDAVHATMNSEDAQVALDAMRNELYMLGNERDILREELEAFQARYVRHNPPFDPLLEGHHRNESADERPGVRRGSRSEVYLQPSAAALNLQAELDNASETDDDGYDYESQDGEDQVSDGGENEPFPYLPPQNNETPAPVPNAFAVIVEIERLPTPKASGRIRLTGQNIGVQRFDVREFQGTSFGSHIRPLVVLGNELFFLPPMNWQTIRRVIAPSISAPTIESMISVVLQRILNLFNLQNRSFTDSLTGVTLYGIVIWLFANVLWNLWNAVHPRQHVGAFGLGGPHVDNPLTRLGYGLSTLFSVGSQRTILI